MSSLFTGELTLFCQLRNADPQTLKNGFNNTSTADEIPLALAELHARTVLI
jgi:hypothetical protein